MEIEKFISYQIENQFPELYRESGRELIEIVKAYYEFLETTPGQYVYEGRRIFEYRDIDSTLDRMVIFFKNKYMKDLPFKNKNIRFVIKNIIDLYRRRGSEEGLILFFKMFYDEDITVYYPSKDIFKASDSEWKEGRYLQLNSSTDIFKYSNIIGKKISGSISKAEAIADKVNFIILNKSFIPIIFMNTLVGEFIKFDDVVSEIDGSIESFGRVKGSLTTLNVDFNNRLAVPNNKIGDILNCVSNVGQGGKVIVTNIVSNFTGEIEYDLIDGGFGYTQENTLVLVSDQALVLNVPTGDPIPQFIPLERVEDQLGNGGIVIGQSDTTVGIRMDSDAEFTSNSEIETTDRDVNVQLDFIVLADKNSSSPGPLYPEELIANNSVETAVTVALTETETVSLITDVISNYLDVQLDAANYNDSPALIPMSGGANTVNIDTQLNEAFDLSPFDIGRINGFINLRPGENYVNQVFTLLVDPVLASFNRVDQILTISQFSPSFSVGSEISQGSIKGIIRSVSDAATKSITVTPYSYYGFDKNLPITFLGNNYDIIAASKNYTSKRYGNNAIASSTTEFSIGKVREVDVINSGFGYTEGTSITLTNNSGDVIAVGSVETTGVGIAEGYWSSFNSNLNGYVQDENPENYTYYESGKRIRDNSFYQEFSYEVSSKLDINNYRETLKGIAHLAGTEVFGKFKYTDTVDISSNIKYTINEG